MKKIIPFLVVTLMITITALPALADSIQIGHTTASGNNDVTLDACLTTDYVNGWQDHGLRIKEWPIDGAVYVYVEVSSDDLSNVKLTHRWWYDNGTGLENKWDWNWVIPEPWTSCWSYTWWQIGLDYGKGVGYIEVLADDVSIGRSNWYAMENTQPNKPTITGETSGEDGVEYEYTFTAIDPDGFDISYFVDWGDDTTTGWTDYVASGTDVKLKHTFAEGEFTITCKVKDLVDNESDWGELTVTMPRNKPISINIPFQRFLQRHSDLFPILRLLLQRLGL